MNANCSAPAHVSKEKILDRTYNRGQTSFRGMSAPPLAKIRVFLNGYRRPQKAEADLGMAFRTFRELMSFDQRGLVL